VLLINGCRNYCSYEIAFIEWNFISHHFVLLLGFGFKLVEIKENSYAN